MRDTSDDAALLTLKIMENDFKTHKMLSSTKELDWGCIWNQLNNSSDMISCWLLDSSAPHVLTCPNVSDDVFSDGQDYC